MLARLVSAVTASKCQTLYVELQSKLFIHHVSQQRAELIRTHCWALCTDFLVQSVYQFPIAIATNHCRYSGLKKHSMFVQQFYMSEGSEQHISTGSLAQTLSRLKLRCQWGHVLSEGFQEESASELMQIAASIQFLGSIRLRSPFPCCLSMASLYSQRLPHSDSCFP